MRRAIEKAFARCVSSPQRGGLRQPARHGLQIRATRWESTALKGVLNDHAYRIAISSTKPVTGHLLAAAGALETAVCAFTIQHQEIPDDRQFSGTLPTGATWITFRTSHAPYPVRVALNCSVGFGGKNSCLVLKEYKR